MVGEILFVIRFMLVYRVLIADLTLVPAACQNFIALGSFGLTFLNLDHLPY